MVERILGKAEVASSILADGTIPRASPMTRTPSSADAKAARLAAALRANLRRRKAAAAPAAEGDDAPPHGDGAPPSEGLYQATDVRPRGQE